MGGESLLFMVIPQCLTAYSDGKDERRQGGDKTQQRSPERLESQNIQSTVN